MDPPVIALDGKLVCFKEYHNENVEMIVMDDQIPIYDRLLCLKCFKQKRQVSKYISIEETQQLIDEKLNMLNKEYDEKKSETLKSLNEFTNKMINTRSRVVKQFDEILRITEQWITVFSQIKERKSNINNFIEDLELLSISSQSNLDYLDQINQSHYKKVDYIIQKLIAVDDYQVCQNQLKSIINIQIQQEQYVHQVIKNTTNVMKEEIKPPVSETREEKKFKIKVQLQNSIKQEEFCNAIAFNSSGSIMAAGCGKDIKIWKFEQGKMIEKKILVGHSETLLCLLFSKKQNWLVSGGFDKNIKIWKEQTYWSCVQSQKQHYKGITCLTLNNQEDSLISCGMDNQIIVWKVCCPSNQLEVDYSLERRHSDVIFSMSLNESETILVTCGRDFKIIIWKKGKKMKWEYQCDIEMEDYGKRISFLDENLIMWQQKKQGVIHILQYNNGQILKKKNLNIELNQEYGDEWLFPTIIHRKKQIVIQRHNRLVYILNTQPDGKLSIASEPIDCLNINNFGALTQDGRYLSIWNDGSKEFIIYKIEYQ